MTQKQIILTVFGMGVVTYIPRCLPFLFFSNRKIPKRLEKWLSFIPISIFGSLIFPEILTSENILDISFSNIKLVVSFIVFVIAFKTRSMGWSIVVGMILFWILGRGLM